MQNEIDGKFLLNLYSKIEKSGQAVNTEQGAGFELEGITVSQGFDGYEVYFTDGQVQLTLGFHNKWHADAAEEKTMERFLERLKHIQTHY
ncbi:DUF3081 domain-containing protein [Rheinheimera sp. UJ51]|uniref:DUF3081 family protein n=1 Tax=unclassified Rheinheimera TaxID=115860 RepID=UPI001E60DC56|nr:MULTISPECIES: DUF3081 family protein [unclassified Rheinheimera]MCC5452076.1 DUF3081 domain-containing protein [Rheinheimera sp. UJ51]MCF4009791.1 DUF3081 domain-containing protein [Rheinheimera sp. UJ63]